MSAEKLEEGEMCVKDWRKALRTPPAYRIVNRTLRSQAQFMFIVASTGILILIIFYIVPGSHSSNSRVLSITYNYTYPLTPPIKSNAMLTFRIGIIADLDTNSKTKSKNYTWHSYLKKGYLSYSPRKKTVVVSWDRTESIELESNYALKDRGMELSELVVFDGKLLTFDDRTGIIFEILNEKVVPWLLLLDGNGRSGKGFKSEWATVKDESLYVGSMGKEWTTASGDFENHNPQYIKIVSTSGQVKHVNWVNQYKKIREVLSIYWPGYMIHESGVWSIIHRRWFFLPRRCSTQSYNETLDEHQGCSVLISADPDMYDVKKVEIPNHIPSRGFSSFKFIPTSEDTAIVALRTEEINGRTATYITAFTIIGEILLEDTLISDLKYEGLEFI